MNLKEFYKFYPGSIWLKRTGHLLVMCSVGAAIFLNEVQDILLQKSEKILADAQLMTKPVAAEAENVKQNIVPVVKYIISSSRVLNSGARCFSMLKLIFRDREP